MTLFAIYEMQFARALEIQRDAQIVNRKL